MTASTPSGDTDCLNLPSCPGCPPALRPVGFLGGLRLRIFRQVGSDDGGLDELDESYASRASISATRDSRRRTCCGSSRFCSHRAAMMAFASSRSLATGGPSRTSAG